jgi:nitroreductase
MNEIISSMIERRSVRNFKEDLPGREAVQEIIEAGLYAASGMGRQPVIIIDVTDRKLRDRLSEVNWEIGGWNDRFDPFYGAPEVLIVLADKSAPTYLYDGSLAMGNLMNAAHALGLGSCWIHRAKEEFESEEGKAILKKLGIEGNYEGIGNLILGYAAKPAGQAAPRKADYVYTV